MTSITLERLARAFEQPIYVTSPATTRGDGIYYFTVQSASSTTTTYTVSVDVNHSTRTPPDSYADSFAGPPKPPFSCSCPDHLVRGNTCKHICFVLLRYMRLDRSSSLVRLLGISQAYFDYYVPPTRAAGFDYLYKSRDIRAPPPQIPASVCRQSYEGAECAICCDEMTQKQEIVFCERGCGQNVHGACMQRWLLKNETCVYCRCNWWLN
jgi:hypothetical protein